MKSFNLSIFQSSNRNKGQVMLLTVLILSGAILGASTIAGYLVLLKIRASSDIANSAKAIFAADAGIEWDLYQRFKNNDNREGTFINPVSLSNGAIVKVIRSALSTKSIGQSSNSFRALEIEF